MKSSLRAFSVLAGLLAASSVGSAHANVQSFVVDVTFDATGSIGGHSFTGPVFLDLAGQSSGGNTISLTTADAFVTNTVGIPHSYIFSFNVPMQIGLDPTPFAFFGTKAPRADLVHLALTSGDYFALTHIVEGSPVTLGGLGVAVFNNSVSTTDGTLKFSTLTDTLFQYKVGELTVRGNNTGTLNISAVPELSTWMMMLIGFAGIGFTAYRRGKKVSLAGMRT